MQDWLLVVTSLAAVLYFLTYPDQFTEIMGWLTRWIQ
jgi:hypothetical protein